MSEFDLIRRYFQRPVQRAALGVGDDCALLAPAPGMQLAISSDMLVEGRHFFPDVNPRLLGHKALAVNLSDLAASGAKPLAFTLALSLPRADEAWISEFAQGMFALADAHDCELIGGDTTGGPLNICITVFGEVPAGQALLRSARARAMSSGSVASWAMPASRWRPCWAMCSRLPICSSKPASGWKPHPRVALGLALRGIASSALDVSDGLLGDLGHILDLSKVGATVDSRLTTPLIAASAYPSSATWQFNSKLQQLCTLAGGDDYELCFTAPATRHADVLAAGVASSTPVHYIGHIDAQPGLRVLGADGRPMPNDWKSFDHFGS